MSVSKTFHALRSGSPTSDNPVKLPRRVRKSWMEMRSWVSPDQSLLDTQAHRSTHRPALQGLLVVSCLCGLPQQLMVSRTAAHGKPQQLGETEAQRRQRESGVSQLAMPLSQLPLYPATLSRGGSLPLWTHQGQSC